MNRRIEPAWLARSKAYAAACEENAAVRRLWFAERQRLRRDPAGGLIGPSEWTDAFLPAGYAQFFWPGLAAVFAGRVHNGDAQALKDAYDNAVGAGDDNGYGAPRHWRLHVRYPCFTWDNAWLNAPCAFWRVRPGEPVKVDGRKVPGILLLGEPLEAATPFPGSLEVRRRYPRASLIATRGGATHANSLAGNACVDDRIAAYLADGTLPARLAGNRPDVACAPLPQPQPEVQAASASAGSGTAAPRLRLKPVPR